ncbi:MAG: hypothetical protein ACI87O_001512 [Planctomycetota bacterium]|jgi:hypothetical protein
MVANAYDLTQRGNPMAFFGMLHVLEGTSTLIASQAAISFGSKLNLPAPALTDLTRLGPSSRSTYRFSRG